MAEVDPGVSFEVCMDISDSGHSPAADEDPRDLTVVTEKKKGESKMSLRFRKTFAIAALLFQLFQGQTKLHKPILLLPPAF